MSLNHRQKQTGNAPWLFIILCAAAVASFHELGLPSQWYDEMNLTLTALNPVRFIIERSTLMDTHPPTFALITKLALEFARTDFAARFIPALSGLACILAVYFLGRLAAGGKAGLWAAALMAASPTMLHYSREVRPYSLFVLVFILTCQRLLAFLERRDRRTLLALCLANAVLALLHFISMVLVAVQGMAAIGLLLADKDRPFFRDALRYCLGTLLSCLPGAYFALSRMGSEASYDKPRMEVLGLYGDNLWRVLFENMPFALAVILSAACLGGLVVLSGRNRKLFWLILGYAALPCLLLVAGRYNSYFNPWHLSFLVPLAAVCAGAFIAQLPILSLRFAPALAAMLATTAFMTLMSRHYYTLECHDGPYKGYALAIAPMLAGGDIWLTSDTFNADAVNWYLKDMAGIDDFRNPKALPGAGGGFLRLAVLDRAGAPTNPPPEYDGLGPAERTEPGRGATVFTWPMPQARPMAFKPGAPVTVTAKPGDLFRFAVVNAVTHMPHGGGAMVPFIGGIPGTIRLEFENTGLDGGMLALGLGYRDKGGKGRVSMSVAFDSEPARSVFVSTAPDGSENVYVTTPRYEPFSRLTVEIALSQQLPGAGDDLDLTRPVGFKDLTLTLFPIEKDLPFPAQAVNLGPVQDASGTPVRWGYGPKTTFTFQASEDGPYRLDYSLFNPVEGQVVWTEVNGRRVDRYGSMVTFPWIMFADQTVHFTAKKGENVVVLRYLKFYGPGKGQPFMPGDERPLSVMFRKLAVSPASGPPPMAR